MFFLQKKLVEAEKYLKQALHEAKLGFGEADPHVAGAFNNLAELHRLKQEVPEAEELYQQVHTQFHFPCARQQAHLGATDCRSVNLCVLHLMQILRSA